MFMLYLICVLSIRLGALCCKVAGKMGRGGAEMFRSSSKSMTWKEKKFQYDGKRVEGEN